MAANKKIQPPFAWLGRFTIISSLVSAVAIGAFFRFFQLASLPPGIDAKAADTGIQAAKFADQGIMPSFNVANGYAPLWVWLQALSVKVFGNTELALRLWPALLGTLAILAIWLWVRSWFGVRIAWLSALLLAVTPWAVTMSRNGNEAALFPLLVPLTLWLVTLAYRQPNVWRYLALVGVILVSLLSGPMGWLVALCTGGLSIITIAYNKHFLRLDQIKIIALAVLLIGLAGFSYLVATSLESFKNILAISGLVGDIGTLGSNLVKILLMFNVRGDESYLHNLTGEPLLNAFVGLMLVAGILVGIYRLHQHRYRRLFALLIVLLLPAVVTSVGVPNSGRAAAVLPIILVIVAIGISYMLELWYATFPINSAARATGQAAVIILMGLTLFQGYTQYFQAWGGSNEVHAAYNEGSVQMVRDISTQKFAGQRYVVMAPSESSVVDYLAKGKFNYHSLQAGQIAGLPLASEKRQFIITAQNRDEAAKILRVKFPGGILRPHYSEFNLSEIYYTYEVGK